MAASEQHDGDDGMDAFMDNFKIRNYKNALSEDNWQEVTATRHPVNNIRNGTMCLRFNVLLTRVPYRHVCVSGPIY